MDNNQLATVNEVEISGRIVTERGQKDGYIVVTMISNNGREIYPKFLCKKELLPEHGPHSRIRMKGHFQTFQKKIKNRWVRQQRLVADSIVLEETLTEKRFGIKGKFFPKMDCIVYLLGTILSVKEEGEWYRYLLEVDGEKAGKKIALRLNMKRLDRHPDIRTGDIICCVCTITTAKKIYDGEDMYFEDLLVSDIVAVKSAAYV